MGVPRVTAELKEAGRPVNHKRVERGMRTFPIVGLHLRKMVRTNFTRTADRIAETPRGRTRSSRFHTLCTTAAG